MSIPRDYLKTIERAYPNLPHNGLEYIQEGFANDVVIVNGELVCRFPKLAWASDVLQHEARVLDLLRSYTDVRLPRFEILEKDFASYRFLPGVPLTRNLLLRLPATTREAVLHQVAEFVQAMHTIPPAEVRAAGIGPRDPNRDRSWYLAFHQEIVEHLYPHMFRYQHAFVEEHFAPLFADELPFDHQPSLVHDDLGSHHLLFDPERSELAGVLDFGTAGLGDPAGDVGLLLQWYGETLVAPMLEVYPGMREFFDRARFRAGVLELEWALKGLLHEDRGFAVAHLGGPRDLLPVGSPIGGAQAGGEVW